MFKGKTPLIIAFALAVGAGLLIWRQMKMWKDEVTRGWQLQNVVVASADLQPGVTLQSDSVAVDKMPRRFIYESVLVPADMEVALGREVVVPIKRGEPIHWYQLQGIRSLERLSKTIKRGGRAVAIDVSERSSAGQWIRPNDHVDVLASFRDPGTNQTMAVTLLQNIIVLATGQTSRSTQSAQRSDTSYGSVTLMVLPAEAEILVLAQELGTLYLTLRNKSDLSVFEERGARTTIETLVTGERMEKLRKRRIQTIQIIRGTQDKARQ